MILRSPLLGFALFGIAAALLFAIRIAARRLGVTLRWRSWAIVLAIALLGAGPRLLDGNYLVPPLDPGLVPGLPGLDEPPSPFGVLNDVQLQLVPWELELRRLVADGAPPFWSHRLGGGSCLWCNPQVQVVSPLAWLARPFGVYDAFLVLLVLKLLTAAAGAAVLARRLGLREPYALWAAGTFALSGGTSAWALFPISTTLAFVPWVVAAAVAIARGERTRVLTGALLVGALWASGHPETAVAGLALAGLAAFALRRRRRSITAPALHLAAFVVAGTLLAAPLLLPFAHAALDSVRFADMLAVQPGSTAPPSHWLLRLFSGGDLAFALGPLGPDVYGRPYRDPLGGPYDWPTALSLYCGLQAVAGLALLGRSGLRRSLPFALHALASLLAAMKFLPFEAIRGALPGLGSMAPTRLLPVACLSIALSAAFGWQRAGRGSPRWWSLAAAGSVLLAAIALAPTARTLAEATIGGALLFLLVRRLATPRLLLATQVVLLASWGWNLLPSTPGERVRVETPEMNKLRESVAALPFGAVVGYDFELYPNLLPALGVRDARPHDPLARADLREVLRLGTGIDPDLTRYFSPLRFVRPRFFERLGICCIVAHRQHGLEIAGASTVEVGARQVLRIVHPALAPAGPVARLRGHSDEAALLRWLATDPPPDESGWIGADEAPPPSRIDQVRFLPNRLQLAGSFAGGSVVRTPLFEPERWRVSPASAALAVETLDTILLGLRTSAYEGTIELRYEPAGLRAGLALALAALIAVALLGRSAAPDAARRDRRQSPADPSTR